MWNDLIASNALPIVFAGLMGLSILIYVILDGFDLGVGTLSIAATPVERDRMVAAIGPFWDANETWLVLAVGLLLVAFPIAHGTVLTALYLPVLALLVGLILRGVAFEFRSKAPPHSKPLWDRAFWAGSTLSAASQGFMLGIYIMGLVWSWQTILFAGLTTLCVVAGYNLQGACWLIRKTEGDLQVRARRWARRSLPLVALGFLGISVTTPLVSPRLLTKWTSLPEAILLAPLPLMTILLLFALYKLLSENLHLSERWSWLPFAASSGLFVTAFFGLAYSFYPYVVPERLTIYEAAAAPNSLSILLFGVGLVLPLILGYTFLSYRLFRGKSSALRYD